MEDIIKQSGGTFGTNEVMILSQLSLAAIPTSAIIFLDLVVDRPPTVCLYNSDHTVCDIVHGMNPVSVCDLAPSNWSYSNADESIISSFDMLCWPKFYLILTDLFFYLGMLGGCSLAGWISDILGRKPTLMMFLFGETLFTGLLILAGNYWVWAVLRFMTGLGIGYFVVCKVLIIESVKINYRHLFLGILWGLFAVGILCLAIMDQCFHRYIDIIACITVYLTFLWLMYLFGIEESLRWLIVKRKKEDATYQLNKIQYRNKVKLPKYDNIPKPCDDEYSFHDIVTQSKSRQLITILVTISIVSYYLLVIYTSMEVHDLSFDMALNLAIAAGLHLIGVLLSATSVYFIGRRPTATTQLTIILLLLVLIMVSMMTTDFIIFCAMGIRCFSAGLVYFCSLYSLEVFASPFRAKAGGLVLSGAAVGGILSALGSLITSYLMWDSVKCIVQAVVVVAVTIWSLSLRETKGRPLPERIEQMPAVLPFVEWCTCGNTEEELPLLETPPNIRAARIFSPGESEFLSTSGRLTRNNSI